MIKKLLLVRDKREKTKGYTKGDRRGLLATEHRPTQTMSMNHVRLAVNDAFVDWSTPLNDGDAVVFIPPVAGG